MNFNGTLERPGIEFLRGQRRMLVTTIIGYTLFYFLRKNLSLAMPGLAQDCGITKTSLGLFLTLHGVVYGVGKFVAGPISDRSRPRLFLMGGLLLALIANVVFGFGPVLAKLLTGGVEGAAFTTALITALGVAWVANGFFQSMGNPPCLKLLAHWVPPEELATKLAIWNSSHSIGAGLITILCGYIMGLGELGADGVGVGMWRWCFWAPSLVVAVGLVAVYLFLPGLPREEGLVDLKETEVNGASADSAESGVTVGRMVFRNPVVWILCGANFSLNLVRFVILDWGPMLLKEFKGLSLAKASWVVALYEIAGVAGMIFAGWATDRWAKGRGNRVCFFMMLGSALAMTVFLLVPGSAGIVPLLATLAAAGFFVYGPQTLTGSILTNIATKRFAGTAIGLNAIFSYASVIFTGVGMGALADRFGGWTVPLVCVIGVAVFGSLVFLSLWRTPANSYDKGFEPTHERSERR